MDAEALQRRARSFGGVASGYARHRPGYPAAAVRWLAGSSPGRVLELGAGTGLLTRELLPLGHEVVASDPSSDMLAHVRTTVPTAKLMQSRAEAIPLPTSSVDVVVAAQAYHWFDATRALPEIARVLRPGGVLALAWNVGDRQVPWVKRLFDLIGESDPDDSDPVARSGLFAPSDAEVFRHWQQLDKEAVVGLIASTSFAATLASGDRDQLLDDVRRLYDGYGRGPDGLVMPWRTRCYRARVSGLGAQAGAHGDDDYDDDALLIDFS